MARGCSSHLLLGLLRAAFCLLPLVALADSPVELGRGKASYYRGDYQGVTASGDHYHPDRLTAAHPSLPLGSWVRVTNLRSGQAVIVRVNDRSPFVAGNMIDVSRAAAEKLGLVPAGIAEVSLTLLPPPPAAPTGDARLTPVSGSHGEPAAPLLPVPPPVAVAADTVPLATVGAGPAPSRPVLRVQFGAFQELEAARKAQDGLRRANVETVIYRRESPGPGEPVFRLVTSGGFRERSAAEEWLGYIQSLTGRHADAYVTP